MTAKGKGSASGDAEVRERCRRVAELGDGLRSQENTLDQGRRKVLVFDDDDPGQRQTRLAYNGLVQGAEEGILKPQRLVLEGGLGAGSTDSPSTLVPRIKR